MKHTDSCEMALSKAVPLQHIIRGHNGLRSFEPPYRHKQDGEIPATLGGREQNLENS
jgi:hypothetical protein